MTVEWDRLTVGSGIDITSNGRWTRTLRCAHGVWSRPRYHVAVVGLRVRVPWLAWALFARRRTHSIGESW